MRWTLMLIALALPSVVAGQELTLENAVTEAVASSPAVLAADASTRAARAHTDRARSFRLPQIDLLETYTRTDNPAEVFALTLNQERFDLQSFFAGNPNRPDALDTWITRLEVVQPIYTGGRLAARVGQAEAMQSAAELMAAHVRETTAFSAVEAFLRLATARENLALLRKARDTTARHVELAGSYAGQGLILEADLLTARVHLAEMDEMVARADTGARLAEAALNLAMGADQRTPRALAPVPSAAPVQGELESWLSAATERRRDLLAARQRAGVNALEERVARAGFMPEVAVVGRYDLYDDTVFGSHGDSGALMAVARINLFRGGGDSAARRAAGEHSQAADHDLRRMENGVELEIRQAWHELTTAHIRQKTAASVLTAAAEALRVREHRFTQGLDRMVDLLDAEVALREAELRELVARYDAIHAAYRLRFASGASLLDDNGTDDNGAKESS